MKKTYLIYNLWIGLCFAFILQSCSKQNELEDYGKVSPTIQITTPTTGIEIDRNRIDHTVTVSGTLTGTNLTSLSYVLNDGMVIEVPDFNDSSPDFTFDLDFSELNEGDTENASLTVMVKDDSGEEASQTVSFKVKMMAYAIPVIEITSPAASATVEIPFEGSLAFTGTVVSQGLSSLTYTIGDGDQPLTATNNAFSQELAFADLLPGESKSVTLTVNAKDAILEPGNKSITFTVKRHNGDPGTIAGNTGSVYFQYSGEQVKYTTVRAKDGNIWLQQNLGSTQVATKIDDSDAYGDYFQWGRWDDGGQKAMVDGVKGATKTVTVGGANNPSGLSKTGPNAFFLMSSNPAAATSSTPPAAPYDVWWRDGVTANTWTAATPAAVTSTNGCDPCRAATNNEWRLPTAAEWNQLMIDEGIIAAQGLATAHASTLKLVAAGYRNAYGNVISQGSTSAPIMFVATSSTTANHSKYGGGAAILNIRVTTATTATGFQRYYGVSVRCLKNVSL